MAHWWLAYYFLSTTTEIGYQIELHQQRESYMISTVIDSEDIENLYAKIDKRRIRRQKSLFCSFIIISVLFLVVSAVRIVARYKLMDMSTARQVTFTVLNILPAIEILPILVAIILSLIKLRTYHQKYKLDIDRSKLWLHFGICILLFLVFFMDFFRM